MTLFAKSMIKLEKQTNNLFDMETNTSVQYHEEFVMHIFQKLYENKNQLRFLFSHFFVVPQNVL